MKAYKAYCFDLDGTVYRGGQGIQTAIDFIHQIQAKGIEPFYVTNNSSKTRQQLQNALSLLGIQAPVDHIFSSALATAKYVVTNYPNKRVALIGSDGLRDAMANEGIELAKETPEVFVIGIDRTLNYSTLADACVSVQNGATLIATNQDIKFPTEQGFVPGNGSFARLVGEVAGVEPIYIGKPSPIMLDVIAKEFGFAKHEMVMIGDNYDTDIQCGIQYGIDTIHVNTGVTSTDVVRGKEHPATYLVENLSRINL